MFKQPIKHWQLESISDSAEIFGRNFYKYGALKDGITIMLDLYKIQGDDKEGKELVRYAFKKLAVNVNSEYWSNLIYECETY